MTAIAVEAVIEEARRRAKRRRLALAGLVALLVVGGGIWAGLALSGGGAAAAGPVPTGFDRVRASGPVKYFVLDERFYGGSNGIRTTRLATGASGSAKVTEQYWYDAAGQLARDRVTVDGLARRDLTGTCAAFACTPILYLQHFDPERSGFRAVGPGSFRGHKVEWFVQRGPHGAAKVAVDPASHELVGERDFTFGRLRSEVAVLRRAELPANDVSFVLPKGGAPHAVVGAMAPPTTGLTLGYGFGAARRALGTTPLWLGPEFHGHPLRSVSVGTYSFPNRAGNRLRQAPYVRFDYGGNFDYSSQVGRGALTVEVFGKARPWFYEHGPKPGTIVRDWTTSAALNRGGLLIRFSNALEHFRLTAANTVALAKALRPLPTSLKTLPTLRQQ
jgi:hypothetical protein